MCSTPGRDPQEVGPLRLDSALDPVGGRAPLAAPRRDSVPTARHPAAAVLSHEAGKALSAHALTAGLQLGVDAWCAVGASGGVVDGPNAGQQGPVTLTALGGTALKPGGEAAPRELQDAAQDGYGVVGLVRPHEFKPDLGRDPPSRAISV